jgi:hypothetical protein
MAWPPDPSLDTEPTASDQGAQNGGNVGSANPEGSPHENRKGDAVLRSRVGIEQHRDEDDQITQKDGADGLPPIHAPGD